MSFLNVIPLSQVCTDKQLFNFSLPTSVGEYIASVLALPPLALASSDLKSQLERIILYVQIIKINLCTNNQGSVFGIASELERVFFSRK